MVQLSAGTGDTQEEKSLPAVDIGVPGTEAEKMPLLRTARADCGRLFIGNGEYLVPLAWTAASPGRDGPPTCSECRRGKVGGERLVLTAADPDGDDMTA